MTSTSGKRKLIAYTGMLLMGLAVSQITAGKMLAATYHQWMQGVGVLTMFCLSFLMVQVGYEFEIEKSKLGSYGTDYVVAMTAAGLPWILVACWLHYMLPSPLAWASALLMARFAAPTSAGILFNMLEAAGFKETWLFQKARVLAIFDDLDTILFMIPLKMFLVGFKWELTIDALFVSVCLALAWQKMHKVRLPSKWSWTMVYAAVVTTCCQLLYSWSQGRVHLEVLLPAFTIGCVARMCQEGDEGCEVLNEEKEEKVKGIISTIFMLLVGLSMPSLFAGGSNQLSMFATVYHVAAISVLMILGKMFLLFCYRDEADLRSRVALGLGMCPRGEVGAGVIAISLGLGMSGPAVTVAVLSLAINLLLSSGFIVAIDWLMRNHGQVPPSSQSSDTMTTGAIAADKTKRCRYRGTWIGRSQNLGLRGAKAAFGQGGLSLGPGRGRRGMELRPLPSPSASASRWPSLAVGHLPMVRPWHRPLAPAGVLATTGQAWAWR